MVEHSRLIQIMPKNLRSFVFAFSAPELISGPFSSRQICIPTVKNGILTHHHGSTTEEQPFPEAKAQKVACWSYRSF
jgi:hypothetical protein